MIRFFMISTLIIISNGIFTADVVAQQRNKLPLEFTILVGGEINKFKNLDARFDNLNLKKPKSFILSAGVGLSYDFDPVVLGGSVSLGGSGIDKEATYQNFSKIYVSSNRIQSGKIVFSPEIGIGYQQFHTYSSKKGGEGLFDDFLSSDYNQVRLDHKGTALDFALSIKRKKNDSIDPLFRIGYRHGLKSNNWKIQHVIANDAPADRISNVYLQMLLRIGR